MKRLALTAAIFSIAAMSFLPIASAGVVMSETSVTGSADAVNTQKRTIYVQGNKQKVENPDIDSITDLDKGVIYVVDKRDKRYVEMPLRTSAKGSGGPNLVHAMIRMDKTGHRRTIAKQSCTEYRGTQSNALEQVAVSACVSSKAPGADQVIAFEQKMFSRVGVTPPKNPYNWGDDSSGVRLEKQSVVSLRIPDMSQGAYRTASFVTKTKINNIKVEQLPDATFEPPEGFSKVVRAHREQPPSHKNEFAI